MSEGALPPEADDSPSGARSSSASALLGRGGLSTTSAAAGTAGGSSSTSSPPSRSPNLRRSGSSLTFCSQVQQGPSASPSNNLSSNSKEEERRRGFQRVKTVSFANLETVSPNGNAPASERSNSLVCEGRPGGALPPPSSSSGGERGPPGAPPLVSVRLDGGGAATAAGAPPMTDDETEVHSFTGNSAAWGRSAVSSTSNVSLLVPLGRSMRRACCCCCCSSIYNWCSKLGPGSELVFHTREDLELERQQKRHLRLPSRSSTLSSLSNAGGAARSCSLRGSSNPTEKLLRSFPLIFTNCELEELFALNVNHWMSLRLIPMGTLLLLLTFGLWPLLAWSFDQQAAFDHRSTIGIMFNSAMAVTMLSAVALGTVSCLGQFKSYAELFTYLVILLLVTMWGVWNSFASSLLEANFQGYADSRSTEESTALEACTAMSYLYGLLPVVLIDVVLPSRTKYTWIIHCSFFGTSAASIIVRGILNPRFIAPAFVVIRVVTYFILASFLFLGRYAAEVQLRQTFLGWLDTRRRVDRLESDLKRQRSRVGASTSVEQLVHLVKQMQESNQIAMSAASDGLRPDVRSQLQEMRTMLEQCLSILCTTTNLYAVNFGALDNIEHMDIIRAFINDKTALPKDWARARDSLPSSGGHPSVLEQQDSSEGNSHSNNATTSLKAVADGQKLSVEEKQQQPQQQQQTAATAAADGGAAVPSLAVPGRRGTDSSTSKLQQGLQLLPLPRSRRGSQSVDPEAQLVQEEPTEKNSNRSSVFSEMLPKPRRVSRAAYERGSAGEDKLLKVAYLFSPTQGGASTLLSSAGDWRFDTLAYGKETASPLPELGFVLLSPFCIDSGLCSEQALAKFLKSVDKHYLFVPYHNALHGLMVAQKTYALLNLVSLVRSRQSRDVALIIVAGLCHDMGHPGRNNALFSNALEPLALLYNDRAVLENYHACLTFKTLEKPECDIFLSLKTREYLTVRSQIIELILATDMKGHFETVSRFRVRRSAPDFDLFSEDDFWFLSRMFIKAADISHCGVDWSQHFDWCQRVLTEFYDQGDEERLRSLPVSPLCDREKHADAAKSQMSFINFVAKPLFEELAAVDLAGVVEREVLTNVRNNASRWEALSSVGLSIPQFLDPWPASVLRAAASYPPLAAAAVAGAASSTAANASAPVGSKVQLINLRIREKAEEGVSITKIDLRPLLSHGEAGRHRQSASNNSSQAPQLSPRPNATSKAQPAAPVVRLATNGKS